MNIRQCHCCHEFSGPAPEPDGPDDEWICVECAFTPEDQMERIKAGIKRLLGIFNAKYDQEVMKEVMAWTREPRLMNGATIRAHCQQKGELFFHHLMAASAFELVHGIEEALGWKWTPKAKQVIAKWQ